MRQQLKAVTFFTDNTTHQLSKNQCSTSKNKMLKLSTWINALPGLTHHFSNFAAKMMPTKPNTLEYRRHGYRAIRSVADAPIRPNPKPSLLTTPPKTIAHLGIGDRLDVFAVRNRGFTIKPRLRVWREIGTTNHKFRKHVQRRLGSARTHCIKGNLEVAFQENPKVLWRYMKGLRKEDSRVADLLHDGKVISDAKAEILYQQFASVFTLECTGDLPDLGVCCTSWGMLMQMVS